MSTMPSEMFERLAPGLLERVDTPPPWETDFPYSYRNALPGQAVKPPGRIKGRHEGDEDGGDDDQPDIEGIDLEGSLSI